MDIKSYLESGAIENYVLGLASTEEIAEINHLSISYPEINLAVDNLSSDLEIYLRSSSVTPPSYIKERIFESLNLENAFNGRPMHIINDGQLQTPVTSIKQNSFKWKWMAAASFLLFIASSVFNFLLYNRYADKNEAYQALLSENKSLFASNRVFEVSHKEWEYTSKMMSDPTMVMIRLKTAPGKNNKDAILFWDSKTKDVFVMVKELPNPEMGKQLQLWAIVDGKPLDAGMIDTNCTGICKMKNILRAQAFAITLEKAGGNPQPTMEQLMVIGTI